MSADVKANIREAQTNILQSLIECESAIAQLYDGYSEQDQTLRTFWAQLSKEEKMHAAALQGLLKVLDRGHIFLGIGRFLRENIANFLESVHSEAAEIQNGRYSRHRAIASALRIESSLIDSHFYDIVKSDSPEYRQIAQRLSNDTQKHILRIQEHASRNMTAQVPLAAQAHRGLGPKPSGTTATKTPIVAHGRGILDPTKRS